MMIRLTPAGGYDLPGLEKWLERLAAKGLRFATTAGPLTIFEKSEPARVQIHLEPARQKTDQEDPELTALYEAAGWTYLGIFRKNYFVFSTPDQEALAHTDSDTLDYVLARFFRQKLLGALGLLLGNFFLLAAYWQNIPLHNSPRDFLLSLGYFWAEWLSTPLIPLLFALVGLLFADLSYLLGLHTLARLRKRLKNGLPLTPAPGSRLSGGALAVGTVFLTLTLTVYLSYLLDLGYQPLPLEETKFITLTELEGEDFRLSGDRSYTMDFVSHGDCLFEAETWYFQQYGSFSHYEGGIDINDVPRLKITVYRYVLPFAAREIAREWSFSANYGDYVAPPPSHGFDQILYARGENPGGNSGMYLILVRGRTALRAEYQGETDLTQYLDRFAEMMDHL